MKTNSIPQFKKYVWLCLLVGITFTLYGCNFMQDGWH